MGFKRVAWFGPYGLKQLGGIPSYRDRLVDERHLNWGALESHKAWMAVMDPRTRQLEYCGELVDVAAMDRLLSPIIPEAEAARAEALADEKSIREAEAAAQEAEKAKKAAEAAAEKEAAKKAKAEAKAAAEASENPTLEGEAPKKKGRKKKASDDFNFDF